MALSIVDVDNNVLHHVLNNYDMAVDTITMEGKAWKIHSDSGVFYIQSVKYGKDGIRRDCHIVDYLADRGFNNVLRYKRTSDGRLFVKEKGCYYYMKEYANVRECDVNNFDEVLNSIILLSNFHNAMYGIEASRYAMPGKKSRYLPSLYSRWCGRLIKYGRLIENKKIKTEFDIKYSENIKEYYMQGIAALNLLNQCNYDDAYKNARKEKHICHGNFYYHNVLFNGAEDYYLTGFDNMVVDIRMKDLGRFIRKLMSRREYMWDFERCQKIIEAYNSVINIPKDELGILLSIIIFPYRFCKLGRSMYDKRKLLNEGKYIKKLDKQISHIKPRQEFIKDFKNFYSIDI